MTTANLIRKSFDGTTKVVDETQGLVEAIVNTTGIEDLQSDVMEVGCWDGLCKSMSAGEADYPSVLWGHDWAIPVGKVLHAEELMPGDPRLKSAKAPAQVGGLRIIAQYNLDTQRGREAYSDVSKGVIKQWSVGFMPSDDGHKYDSKGVHRISRVGVWPEVSNVLVGASPNTRTTATKSAQEILGDQELSVHEKALALEQAYLAAVEDGDGLPVIETLIDRPNVEFFKDSMRPDSVPAIEPEPQAEPTAEASLALEQQAEWLINYVTDKLSASKPHHSDPAPEPEDLSTPAWVRQNIRPTI